MSRAEVWRRIREMQKNSGRHTARFPAKAKAALPLSHCSISLLVVKKVDQTQHTPAECCAEAATCPLSQIEAGTVVCIKQLTAKPDVIDRLREMGLGEEQRIRLISRHPSLICQVCNARVALSQDLAKAILVEPLSKSR